MIDHTRIEELIAVRALGGLDGPDDAALAAEMASHGPDCPDCRRLQDEYGEVAGRLAFALEPEPVPGGMEDLVVGLATGSAARLEAADGPRRPARRRPGIALRPLVAVAAALVLFVGGIAIGAVVTGGGGREIPANARVVAFQGAPGGGSLSVAFAPDASGAYVVGADLPAPPEGKVYELWMIQGDTPVPGPCLSPAADGSLIAFVDAQLGTTQAMAVTIEPRACSTQPTTNPIFVADLARA